MAKQKIVGIFSRQEEAIEAIRRLKRDGYLDDEISVLSKKRKNADEIKDATDIGVETESPVEGAAGGAAAGGAIGGVGALLAELGLISIPGIGPLLASGPIAVTLAGLIAGGAVGGLAGALVDMGLTKEEAQEYSEYLERGNILVMVDTDEDDKKNGSAYDNFYENNSIIKYSFDRAKFKKKKKEERKKERGTRYMNDPKYPRDYTDRDMRRNGDDPYRPEDPKPPLV